MAFIPDRFKVLDIMKEDERRKIAEIESQALMTELQDAEDIPDVMVKKLTRLLTELDHVAVLLSQNHPDQALHMAILKDKCMDGCVKCIKSSDNPKAIEVYSKLISVMWTTARYMYRIMRVEKQIATEESREAFKMSFHNNKDIVESLINA